MLCVIVAKRHHHSMKHIKHEKGNRDGIATEDQILEATPPQKEFVFLVQQALK